MAAVETHGQSSTAIESEHTTHGPCIKPKVEQALINEMRYRRKVQRGASDTLQYWSIPDPVHWVRWTRILETMQVVLKFGER